MDIKDELTFPPVPIGFKRLRLGAEMPSYATPGSVGVDLRAYVEGGGAIQLHPDAPSVLIPTGFAVDMTDYPGLYAAIYPRSSTGHKLGLVLGNGTGIIDNDYQGEIFISAVNRSRESIVIRHGDRIAQMVFRFAERAEFIEVEEFIAKTERGAGGFGSTGAR